MEKRGGAKTRCKIQRVSCQQTQLLNVPLNISTDTWASTAPSLQKTLMPLW